MRETKRRLESVNPAYASVERWDSRTLSDAHRSVVLYPGRETVREDSINAGGEDEVEFLLHPTIMIAQDEGDAETTDEIVAAEIGRMVAALCDTSDRTWTEPAGVGNQEELILSCAYDGAEEPVQTPDSNAYELEVRFRITYYQLTGDATQGGPATTLTE